MKPPSEPQALAAEAKPRPGCIDLLLNGPPPLEAWTQFLSLPNPSSEPAHERVGAALAARAITAAAEAGDWRAVQGILARVEQFPVKHTKPYVAMVHALCGAGKFKAALQITQRMAVLGLDAAHPGVYEPILKHCADTANVELAVKLAESIAALGKPQGSQAQADNRVDQASAWDASESEVSDSAEPEPERAQVISDSQRRRVRHALNLALEAVLEGSYARAQAQAQAQAQVPARAAAQETQTSEAAVTAEPESGGEDGDVILPRFEAAAAEVQRGTAELVASLPAPLRDAQAVLALMGSGSRSGLGLGCGANSTTIALLTDPRWCTSMPLLERIVDAYGPKTQSRAHEPRGVRSSANDDSARMRAWNNAAVLAVVRTSARVCPQFIAPFLTRVAGAELRVRALRPRNVPTWWTKPYVGAGPDSGSGAKDIIRGIDASLSKLRLARPPKRRVTPASGSFVFSPHVLSSLIRELTAQGRLELALVVWRMCQEQMWTPSARAHLAIMRAASGAGQGTLLWQVWASLLTKRGTKPDRDRADLARNQALAQAQGQGEDSPIVPPLWPWRSKWLSRLILSAGELGNATHLPRAFSFLVAPQPGASGTATGSTSGSGPDPDSASGSGSGSASDPDSASGSPGPRELYAFERNPRMCNLFIRSLAKQGRWTEVSTVLQALRLRGFKPSEDTYLGVIASLPSLAELQSSESRSVLGSGSGSSSRLLLLTTLQDMQRDGVVPNDRTIAALLGLLTGQPALQPGSEPEPEPELDVQPGQRRARVYITPGFLDQAREHARERQGLSLVDLLQDEERPGAVSGSGSESTAVAKPDKRKTAAEARTRAKAQRAWAQALLRDSKHPADPELEAKLLAAKSGEEARRLALEAVLRDITQGLGKNGLDAAIDAL